MNSDISNWLAQLGLGQYAEGFDQHDIDWSLLAKLDHTMLKEIGVHSTGHRIRILEAANAIASSNDAARSTIAPEALGQTGSGAASAQAERRQLTVMFCDLVGSTELSLRLDPEDFREVVRAYQQAVESVTARFGGYVAQYLGDGLLVYFGYPVAHEDDAQRAVHAGIGIPEALARLNTRLMPERGVQLAARVGIHTGPVVVGRMGGDRHSENLAVGDTPNVAARLQARAEPGATVISARTQQLVGSQFALTPIADLELKGVATPTKAFVVVGENHAETRFAGGHGAGATPMVGRRHEMALLLDRWRQAKAGHGQMVVLTGEAGIGKSRIASELTLALMTESHRRVSYQCSSFHTSTALYPVLRQLAFAAGIDASDAPQDKLDRLEHLLRKSPGDISVASQLIGVALELGEPVQARYGTLDVSSEQRRERLLQALLDQLVGVVDERPMLVVLEDAQWIDPTTLTLVDMALESIRNRRILWLVTSRPGFNGVDSHANVSHLSLNRLDRESVIEFVGHVAHGKALPTELVHDIAAKVDGVPLFIEELTKSMLESGQLRDTGQAYAFDSAVEQWAIPNSLRDTLMARLDRVHSIKEVAQAAACIGREFAWPLLAAVLPWPEYRLDAALTQLVHAALIIRRGVGRRSTYMFKHALVRDAAYDSLLLARRLVIHGALLQQLQLDDGVPPEVLAHHAAAAGRLSEAADHWERAGDRAAALSTFSEAISHFEQALQCLGAKGGAHPAGLDDNAGERALRLELRLAHACVARHGHASPLAVQALKRAHDLADSLEASPRRFAAYYGYLITQLVRSELGGASAVALKLSKDAEVGNDPVLRLMAACACGTIATLKGDFTVARESFERGLLLGEGMEAGTLIRQFGHDPRGVARSYLALVLWCTGDVDHAAEMWQQGMHLARAAEHTPSQAQPLVVGAMLAGLSGSQRDFAQCVGDAEAFTLEQKFQMWHGFATCLRAWVDLDRGDVAKALHGVTLGRAMLEATGTRFLHPLVAVIESRALAASGEWERALGVLRDAQRHQDATAERWLASEVWRTLGDIQRMAPGADPAAAEVAYQHALELSRAQGARTLELRAASSLAIVWLARGERQRAAALLEQVCQNLPPGSACADLADARRLLASDLRNP